MNEDQVYGVENEVVETGWIGCRESSICREGDFEDDAIWICAFRPVHCYRQSVLLIYAEFIVGFIQFTNRWFIIQTLVKPL